MLHDQIKQTLASAPPGYIRVFRVDNRHSQPHTWGKLPTPSYDRNPPSIDWMYMKWQCAAKMETVEDWWPESCIEHELKNGGVPTIYEVHKSQCHDCGTQVVFNPQNAVVIQ